MLSFAECKEKHLRRVEPDEDKIASLQKVSRARIKATKQIAKDAETASIIAQGYYKAMKELLTALLLKGGWKSDNHECLILYFARRYPEYGYESSVMCELKNIRNRITYDGVFVRPSYLETHQFEFESILKILETLIAAGSHAAPGH